jgi:hypothetical protein
MSLYRFNERFAARQRSFDFFWKLIWWAIGIITFMTILIWAFGLILGVKIVGEVQNEDFPGAKSYVERLWCGKEGCLDK